MASTEATPALGQRFKCKNCHKMLPQAEFPFTTTFLGWNFYDKECKTCKGENIK